MVTGIGGLSGLTSISTIPPTGSNRSMKYGETMDHVLGRYGEIGTKSREIRRRMFRLLNQRLATEDMAASVSPIHGRLVVETATVAAACRSLAPNSSAPDIERLESLKRAVNIDDLVERGIETTEKKAVIKSVEP